MPRHRTKLTPKESIFVSEFVKTKGNRTEAALRAYDTKSRKNAKQIGMRTVKKPHVREAIEDAFKEIAIDPKWLLEQEKKIIIQGLKEGKPTMTDARLSIQNLHKLYNSYPEKVSKSMKMSVSKNMDSESTDQILEELRKITEATNKLIKDVTKR